MLVGLGAWCLRFGALESSMERGRGMLDEGRGWEGRGWETVVACGAWGGQGVDWRELRVGR